MADLSRQTLPRVQAPSASSPCRAFVLRLLPPATRSLLLDDFITIVIRSDPVFIQPGNDASLEFRLYAFSFDALRFR